MAKQRKKQDLRSQKLNEDLSFSVPLSPLLKKIIPVVLALIPIALGWYYINYAYSINKVHSFPIDDPWIHLTFARNLVEYGSYSYFKNEVVTAGSTSPIYTFVLALGFLITKNEMILSYVLGILFFVISIFFYYRISEDSFPKENWMAIAATLILVTDRWLNFIAVSGMETTMFIFILLACFYFYRKRNAFGFGISAGLILWCRPDGLAFIGAIAVDYIIFIFLKKKSPKDNTETGPFTNADLIKIALIFAVLTAGYFAFNLKLAGFILPNTFNAKLTYYDPAFRSRGDFLKGEVWEYFTESSYLLLIIPFFIAIIKIGADFSKSTYNKFLLPAIFIFALIFIYWFKLPYAHRFGRYLMPVIPFYIMLFMYGARELYKLFYKFINDKKITNALNIILIIAVVVWFASDYYKKRTDYQEWTRHALIRQVAAAKWLKENTPEGSVVATHDVGAIGFYSGRKVIDVAGLINPELADKVLDKKYNLIMTDEMKKHNVSYTAFLKEWYQVVNENPLFVCGDENYEIMEIYKFVPDKTHLLSL